MKLSPIFVGFTALAAAASAQSFTPGSTGHGAPAFNCAVNDTYKNIDDGLVWQCGPTANTWHPTPAFVPWNNGTGAGLQASQLALVPAESFGAVGDWNGTTGTDNTTALQNAINSLQTAGTCGQVLLQAKAYKVTGTLSITKSCIGIRGTSDTIVFPSVLTTPPASVLVTTSPSADIVDLAGVNTSNTVYGNRFQNFTLERSVAPTGSANGLSISYTFGVIIDRVVSMDSINDFYIHASGSSGAGYIDNSVAEWGYNGFIEATGPYRGFFIDSSDGNASPSLRMHNDHVVGNLATSTPTYGYALYGSALNDFMGWNLETATIQYGAYIDGVSIGGIGAQDIHLNQPIFDNCQVSCADILNIPAANHASVDIDGGWMADTGTAATINISNSNNITLRGIQFQYGGQYAIATDSTTSNVSITGNSFYYGDGGILFNGGSDYTVTGNLITILNGAAVGIGIASPAAHITIAGNAFAGTPLEAVLINSGVSDVKGLETNSFDPSITTPISSAIPFLTPPIGSETVTFSATPTFSNITRSSSITLTAAITSFTLASGVDGQQKSLIFCENGTGGFAVTPPANVRGLTVGTTASKCTTATLVYSVGQTAWMTTGTVTNQ